MFDYITLEAKSDYIIDKLNCSAVPERFDCKEQLCGETKLDYYARKVINFEISFN
jgi:hypothetical protein